MKTEQNGWTQDGLMAAALDLVGAARRVRARYGTDDKGIPVDWPEWQHLDEACNAVDRLLPKRDPDEPHPCCECFFFSVITFGGDPIPLCCETDVVSAVVPWDSKCSAVQLPRDSRHEQCPLKKAVDGAGEG